MPKITVSLSDDLYKEYLKIKDNVNASKIVQKGIRLALKEYYDFKMWQKQRDK